MDLCICSLRVVGNNKQANKDEKGTEEQDVRKVSISENEHLVFSRMSWPKAVASGKQIVVGLVIAESNPDPKSFVPFHSLKGSKTTIFVAYKELQPSLFTPNDRADDKDPTTSSSSSHSFSKPFDNVVQDIFLITDKTINAVPKGFVRCKTPLNPNIIGDKQYLAIQTWQSMQDTRALMEKYAVGTAWDVYDLEGPPPRWRNAIVVRQSIEKNGHLMVTVHFCEWDTKWDRTYNVFVHGNTQFAQVNTKVIDYRGNYKAADYTNKETKKTNDLLHDVVSVYNDYMNTKNPLPVAAYLQGSSILLQWQNWYRFKPRGDEPLSEKHNFYAIFALGIDLVCIAMKETPYHKYYHQFVALLMGTSGLSHWNAAESSHCAWTVEFARWMSSNAVVEIKEKNHVIVHQKETDNKEFTSFQAARIQKARRLGLFSHLCRACDAPLSENAGFQHWLKSLQTICDCWVHLPDLNEAESMWLVKAKRSLLEAVRSPLICTDLDVRELYYDVAKITYDQSQIQVEDRIMDVLNALRKVHMSHKLSDPDDYHHHFWATVWVRIYEAVDKLKIRKHAVYKWMEICKKNLQRNNKPRKEVVILNGVIINADKDSKDFKDSKAKEKDALLPSSFSSSTPSIVLIDTQDMLLRLLKDREFHEHIASSHLSDMLALYAQFNSLTEQHWTRLWTIVQGKVTIPIVPVVQTAFKQFLSTSLVKQHGLDVLQKDMFGKLRDLLLTKIDKLAENQAWLDTLYEMREGRYDALLDFWLRWARYVLTPLPLAITTLDEDSLEKRQKQMNACTAFFKKLLTNAVSFSNESVAPILKTLIASRGFEMLKVYLFARPDTWGSTVEGKEKNEGKTDSTLFQLFMAEQWLPVLCSDKKDHATQSTTQDSSALFQLLETVPITPAFDMAPILSALKTNFLQPQRRQCIRSVINQAEREKKVDTEYMKHILYTCFSNADAFRHLDDFELFRELFITCNASTRSIQSPKQRWQIGSDGVQFIGHELLWSLVFNIESDDVASQMCAFISDLETRLYYPIETHIRVARIKTLLDEWYHRFLTATDMNLSCAFRVLFILSHYVQTTKAEALEIAKATKVDVTLVRDMPQTLLSQHTMWNERLRELMSLARTTTTTTKTTKNTKTAQELQRIALFILISIPPNKTLLNIIMMHSEVSNVFQLDSFYNMSATSLSYFASFLSARLKLDIDKAKLNIKHSNALYMLSMDSMDHRDEKQDKIPYSYYYKSLFNRERKFVPDAQHAEQASDVMSLLLMEHFVIQLVLVPHEEWLSVERDNVDSVLLLQVMRTISMIVKLLPKQHRVRLLIVSYLLELHSMILHVKLNNNKEKEKKGKSIYADDASLESIMTLCLQNSTFLLHEGEDMDDAQCALFTQKLTFALHQGLISNNTTLCNQSIHIVRTVNWIPLRESLVRMWTRNGGLVLNKAVCDTLVLLRDTPQFSNQLDIAIFDEISKSWSKRNTQFDAFTSLIKPIWMKSTQRHDQYRNLLSESFFQMKSQDMPPSKKVVIFTALQSWFSSGIFDRQWAWGFWQRHVPMLISSVHKDLVFSTEKGLSYAEEKEKDKDKKDEKQQQQHSFWGTTMIVDGLRGIRNPSNACYIIAIMQQLYMTVTFRQAVFNVVENVAASKTKDQEKENEKEQEKEKENQGKQPRNLIYELQRLFLSLDGSCSSETMSPVESLQLVQFISTCTGAEGKSINLAVQDDASGFCALLLSQLDQQVKGTAFADMVRSSFGQGIARQKIGLDNCAHKTQSTERAFASQIVIKDHRTLEHALLAHILPDDVMHVECEQCAGKRFCTLKTPFNELPPTLTFSLKRFENDHNGNSSKLNSRLVFPFKLDMKPYSVEANPLNGFNGSIPVDAVNHHKAMSIRNYYHYRLVGIVMHRGNLNGGHYFSYILNRFNEEWYEFNDSRVTKINIKDVIQNAYGNGQSHENAFMLYYDRIPSQIPLPMTIKLPQHMVNTENTNRAFLLRDRLVYDPQYMKLVETAMDEVLALPIQASGSSELWKNYFKCMAHVSFVYFFMVGIHSKWPNGKVWMQRFKQFMNRPGNYQAECYRFLMDHLCHDKVRWWEVLRTIAPELDADLSDILGNGILLLKKIHAQSPDPHKNLPLCFQKMLDHCLDLPAQTLANQMNSGTRLFIRNCAKHLPDSITRWFEKGHDKIEKWKELLKICDSSSGSSHVKQEFHDESSNLSPLRHLQQQQQQQQEQQTTAPTARPPVLKGGRDKEDDELKHAIMMSQNLSPTRRSFLNLDLDSTWAVIQDIMLIIKPINETNPANKEDLCKEESASLCKEESVQKKKESPSQQEGLKPDDADWRALYVRSLLVRHLFDDERIMPDSRLNEERVRTILKRHFTQSETAVFMCMNALQSLWRHYSHEWRLDQRIEFFRRQFSPMVWLNENVIRAKQAAENEAEMRRRMETHTHNDHGRDIRDLFPRENHHHFFHPCLSFENKDPWATWFPSQTRPCSTMNIGKFCSWMLEFVQVHHEKDNNKQDEKKQQQQQKENNRMIIACDGVMNMYTLVVHSILDTLAARLETAYRTGFDRAIHESLMLVRLLGYVRRMWAHLSAFIMDDECMMKFVVVVTNNTHEFVTTAAEKLHSIYRSCKADHEKSCEKSPFSTHGEWRSPINFAGQQNNNSNNNNNNNTREQEGHTMMKHMMHMLQKTWKSFQKDLDQIGNISLVRDKLDGNLDDGFSLKSYTTERFAVPSIELIQSSILKSTINSNHVIHGVINVGREDHAGYRIELMLDHTPVAFDFEDPNTLKIFYIHATKHQSTSQSQYLKEENTALFAMNRFAKDLEELGQDFHGAWACGTDAHESACGSNSETQG